MNLSLSWICQKNRVSFLVNKFNKFIYNILDKNLLFPRLEDIGCSFDFSPKKQRYFICLVQYKKKKKISKNFNLKTKPHKNNVNINMEINLDTQKKINFKHNKRIRQKENLRYKQISTYIELKFY